MTSEDFWKLPQANRDWAYLSNFVQGVSSCPNGFVNWLQRLEMAAYKQVPKLAKYYPELDQLYCPECGARLRKYQLYCNCCGQYLDGTHDGNKPEIINQEPEINNDTGEVDWGQEEG